jgi:hypothetical protein
VATRVLIDRFRVGRQLVPEAVEIDALAALYQPLHVGTAEIEMPEQGAFQNLVPRSDAGQWGIHDRPARDPCRILGGEGVAHHVADVMGDELGPVDGETVEHAGDILALRLLVVAAGGMG